MYNHIEMPKSDPTSERDQIGEIVKTAAKNTKRKEAGYRTIPSYDAGIDRVPEDQVALIHEGEKVVPADENPDNQTDLISTQHAEAIPAGKSPHPRIDDTPNEAPAPLISTPDTSDKSEQTLGKGLADNWLKRIGAPVTEGMKAPASFNQGSKMNVIDPSGKITGEVQSTLSTDAIPTPSPFKQSRIPGLRSILTPEQLASSSDANAPLINAEEKKPAPAMGKEAFNTKVKEYDQQYQSLLDQAAKTNDPALREQAARVKEAKLEYMTAHPWGAQESAHPGILGKLGHVAEIIASRAPGFAPIMATMPQSEVGMGAQREAAREQVKEASAENTAESKPEHQGTPEQQYIKATTDLRSAQASGDQVKIAAAQQRLNDIHDAIVTGKTGKETREDHLTQYAGLKNKVANGEQLSGPEQTAYNTLKTELTVPTTVRMSYNKQIDHMLDAAEVKDADTRSAYQIPEDSTAEEAAKFLADAKSTYGENAPARLEAAATTKETAKQKSTMGYVEVEGGGTLMASLYDQQQGQMLSGPFKGAKIIGNFEEAKPGNFSADRKAVQVLNDVQKNVSAYRKALKEDVPAVQNSPDDLQKIEDVVALNEQTGGAAISLGSNGVSVSSVSPTLAAQIKAGALEQARKDLKTMSPAARRVLTAYLRTATSVVAYQKAVTGSARANELQLNLELANIPAPYFDTDTATSRLDAFQENVDIVSDGYPKNLPGVQHPSKLKEKLEAPAAGNAKFHLQGAKGEIFSNDGTTWYDTKGERVGK